MKFAVQVLGPAILVGAQFAVVDAQAGQALDQALGGHCAGVTCTITNNPGGDIDLFARAAKEVVREGRHLRIAGMCASACVLLADLARANTCVTPSAQLAVHKTYVINVTGEAIANGQEIPVGDLLARQDPPQSPDVDRWIRANGGYPSEGVNILPLKSARFWATCS
jgi:hypothetical protein